MKKIFSWLIILLIIVFFAIYIYHEEESSEIKIDYCENNELFCDYYEDAINYVRNMSLNEKIGQLFIARYDDKLYEDELKNYHPGGYIMYSPDFIRTKEEMINQIKHLNSLSKVPLALGLDEEGGSVTRMSWNDNYSDERFESPKNYLKKGGLDLVIEKESKKIDMIKSSGLNYNFAPVLDIATSKKSFMWYRSISADEEIVSEYAKKITKIYNEKQFTPTLKHFPGHGDNGDTHFYKIIDERKKEDLLKDIQPFKKAIDEGVPWIQMSHIKYESLDPNYPATISKTIHEYLRNDLNFSGLIVTDDMEMMSLSDFTVYEKLVLSVKCGNNFMMTSRMNTYVVKLREAYYNGDITDEDLDNIIIRNIAWKYKYGIIKK